MKLIPSLFFFVLGLASSSVSAAEPPQLEPLKASPEERAQLPNSRAWKWRYTTADSNVNLRMRFAHFTREASGGLLERKLSGSSTSSSRTVGDAGKINDVLILLSADGGTINYFHTVSRPEEGSGSSRGNFDVPAKDFIFLDRPEGGAPPRFGEHLILAARTKDGNKPLNLEDITEFIAVTVQAE